MDDGARTGEGASSQVSFGGPVPTFPHLPPDFQFGISSSAFSIEGGADADGRGQSIWDAVAAVPGRTVDGSTGPDAIDHFHRFPDDIALLAGLGVDAYRFSVSWSRVQPTGHGAAHQAGLDFYDRLVDGLLEAAIEPWVTLYHWDLPLELMLRGGWLERDTADSLGDLAALVADRLGDRVHRWTTIADPVVHMAYGHALGVDAPGLTLLGGAFTATHHLLLGHARAREALCGDPSASIGIVNHHTAVTAAGGSGPDRAAAALYDSYHNRQFAEPILLGRYPRLLSSLLEQSPTLVRDGDLTAISAPLDFYGVSYFHPTVVAAAPDNSTIGFDLVAAAGAATTEFDWPVHPTSLTTVLLELRRRYPRLPPVIVAENGAAYGDEVDAGRDRGGPWFRPDHERSDFLRGHLAAIDDAVARGVDVRGYFYRGLTDAWEGSEGLTRHFGLVRVDPRTKDRSPRTSFDFYRRLIRRHRHG